MRSLSICPSIHLSLARENKEEMNMIHREELEKEEIV